MTGLTEIALLARSGALTRAWVLFEARGGGMGDPAALALEGRILKGLAQRAAGEDRNLRLKRAEHAYAAADALSSAPYLLINVATIAALLGDSVRAFNLAGEVLARLDVPGLDETPYYVAAMRAEVSLLMDDREGAERWLAEAISLHPSGRGEHASTLRQFSALLAAQGRDAAWLDAYRPSACLHFAGHLGISSDTSGGLRVEIDALLAEERIGFGFGALAAGADLVVAEALLARGAELHAILPASIEDFAMASVEPFGAAWLDRYRACLAGAASVRIVADAGRVHDPQATALAAEVAMGAAVLDARLHESRAIQLIVADEGKGDFGGGGNSERDGELWRAGGGAQHVLRWSRSADMPSSVIDHVRPDRQLGAVLLAAPGKGDMDEGAFARWIDEGLSLIQRAFGQADRGLTPDGALILSFETPVAAAKAAQRIASLDLSDPPRIAGAYGIVHRIGDQLIGTPVAMAHRALSAALPGMIVVTDLFAQAAAIHDSSLIAEPIGLHDLAGLTDPVALYALPDQ